MNINTYVNNKTGNLTVYLKETHVNPINKETQLIDISCEISKDQIESLTKFNINVLPHTIESIKSERKRIIGKNIYEALLDKANNEINFYNIEKVLNKDKRYFIIGTLEDITILRMNNDTFINTSDNILKNPMDILGNIKIGNTKIDVLYINDKVKNSCLLLSTIKDYDNTYKITF